MFSDESLAPVQPVQQKCRDMLSCSVLHHRTLHWHLDVGSSFETGRPHSVYTVLV